MHAYMLHTRTHTYTHPFVAVGDSVQATSNEPIHLLQGKNLDLAVTADSVTVYVGARECNVTQLGSTVLLCVPEQPEELSDDEPYRTVKVSVCFFICIGTN